MDKKQKTLLIILGVSAVAVVTGYFLYTRGTLRRLQNSLKNLVNKGEENKGDKGNNSVPPTVNNNVNDSFPLKRGSNGPRVLALQNFLIKKKAIQLLPMVVLDHKPKLLYWNIPAGNNLKKPTTTP